MAAFCGEILFGGTMHVGYLAHGFDLLNIGDLDVIAQVRARCSRLIIGVLSDESIQTSTGRPPVVPLAERVALVRHTRGVDAVVVHDETDAGHHREATTVFRVSQRTAFSGDQNPVLLTPARTTASPTLRHALRPTLEPAAA